jgi:Fe-S cluster biogenesis protein NfuA
MELAVKKEKLQDIYRKGEETVQIVVEDLAWALVSSRPLLSEWSLEVLATKVDHKEQGSKVRKWVAAGWLQAMIYNDDGGRSLMERQTGWKPIYQLQMGWMCQSSMIAWIIGVERMLKKRKKGTNKEGRDGKR